MQKILYYNLSVCRKYYIIINQCAENIIQLISVQKILYYNNSVCRKYYAINWLQCRNNRAHEYYKMIK